MGGLDIGSNGWAGIGLSRNIFYPFINNLYVNYITKNLLL